MSLIMDNLDTSDNQDCELKIDELKELVKNLTIKNQELKDQVRESNENSSIKCADSDNEAKEQESLNERNRTKSNNYTEETEIIALDDPNLHLSDSETWLMESNDHHSDARSLTDWLAIDLHNRDQSYHYQLLTRLRDIARGFSSCSPPPVNNSFVDTRTFTRKRRQDYYSRTYKRDESFEDDRLSSASDSSNTFQEIQHAARLQEESLKSTRAALADSGLGREIGVDGATSSQSDLDRAAYPASVDSSRHSSSPPDSPYSSQSLDQNSGVSVAPRLTQEALRGSLPNLSIQRGLSRMQPLRGMSRRPPPVTNHVQAPTVRKKTHQVTSMRMQSTTTTKRAPQLNSMHPPRKLNVGAPGTSGLRRPSGFRPASSRTQVPAPPPDPAPAARSNIPSRLPRAGGIPRPTTSKLPHPKTRSTATVNKYQQHGVSEDWRDGCF